MIELEPAQKNTEFQNFKNGMCKILNVTAIASSYVGHDPQGGTSDGIFFSKFSFILQLMVKILLLFFKRKEKNGVTVKLGRRW